MAISCARCGAAAAPDAAFCSACGAPLDAGDAAERKLATLVFADLVGSTEMIAGRDPEEVRGMLDPFYELARGVLEDHGGRVEKFIGDAVVAAFGVPRAHGDDPDRALAAALALVDRLAAHDPRLVLRIGIETGEVLAGPRAASSRSPVTSPTRRHACSRPRARARSWSASARGARFAPRAWSSTRRSRRRGSQLRCRPGGRSAPPTRARARSKPRFWAAAPSSTSCDSRTSRPCASGGRAWSCSSARPARERRAWSAS